MPYYEFRCPRCGSTQDIFMSYDEFTPTKIDYCTNENSYVTMEVVIHTTPVQLKGYGFFKTDNADSHEKYARDHFDGSGTNAEMKQMDRVIQDPGSDVPKRPKSNKFFPAQEK